MALWLRARTALAVDLSSLPAPTACSSQTPITPALCSYTHGIRAHRCIYVRINKTNKPLKNKMNVWLYMPGTETEG